MSAGYVPSPYVVNLQSLQNFNSNITGLDPLAVLTNSVANIQQMVNFDQKRIFINTISKFNQMCSPSLSFYIKFWLSLTEP